MSAKEYKVKSTQITPNIPALLETYLQNMASKGFELVAAINELLFFSRSRGSTTEPQQRILELEEALTTIACLASTEKYPNAWTSAVAYSRWAAAVATKALNKE